MNGYLIRPARSTDLPTLSRWLGRTVELPAQAQDRLLVVESNDGNLPLRASLRLVTAIGLALPRVSYHVGCTVHAAQDLGLFHQQRTLLLGHDLTGASELADMAWERDGVSQADQANPRFGRAWGDTSTRATPPRQARCTACPGAATWRRCCRGTRCTSHSCPTLLKLRLRKCAKPISCCARCSKTQVCAMRSTSTLKTQARYWKS
jgi:hypothetical protein